METHGRRSRVFTWLHSALTENVGLKVTGTVGAPTWVALERGRVR